MFNIPFYQVDAFADSPFGGNPAAVCLLDAWMEDTTLQSIAVENNLSETAFLVKEADTYRIRWFTPATEVKLCGHATLASAFVLFHEGLVKDSRIHLNSLSGPLSIQSLDGELVLDFPTLLPKQVDIPDGLEDALGGVDILSCHQSQDMVALLSSEADVKTLNPDFQKLKEIPSRGIIVTAPGESCDFVSRFFGPRVGVNEDPVTGSAHCILIPFWGDRLGKKKMSARQLSQRGGSLSCEWCGERVKIGGKARLMIKGVFSL